MAQTLHFRRLRTLFSHAAVRLGMPILALTVWAATAGASPDVAVAGKWAGTIGVHDTSSGTDISTAVELMLEETQTGAISGTIGRDGDDRVPIRNGKRDNGHITFEAASGETDGPMKFSLTLDGDRLEGDMRGAVETQDIVGTVKLSRRKN